MIKLSDSLPETSQDQSDVVKPATPIIKLMGHYHPRFETTLQSSKTDEQLEKEETEALYRGWAEAM